MKRSNPRLKRILLIVLLVIVLLPVLTSKTYLYKAVAYNFANIDDYTIFDNEKVAAGTPLPWQLSADYGKIKMPDDFEEYLTSLKTVGVVVIKDRKLLFEKY